MENFKRSRDLAGLERAPLGWTNRSWAAFAQEGQGREEARPTGRPLGAHPGLRASAGNASFQALQGEGAPGPHAWNPDLPPWAPLWTPGTFRHSPASPVSGHQILLLEGGPGACDRRRHFSLFPGCERTAHNPNTPRAAASSASQPRPPKHNAPAPYRP